VWQSYFYGHEILRVQKLEFIGFGLTVQETEYLVLAKASRETVLKGQIGICFELYHCTSIRYLLFSHPSVRAGEIKRDSESLIVALKEHVIQFRRV
jgi:hypothetical protein